ncbi:MAG: hypothetical protein R2699_00425 [Acidimicrobiales bacterium]
MHIHGLADVNHPIDGGPGEGVADVVFRPARDGVEDDGGGRRLRASTRRPKATARPRPGPAATTTAPSPSCASPAHPMPGPVARQAGRCRDRPTRLDATAAIWAFLMAHPAAEQRSVDGRRGPQ